MQFHNKINLTSADSKTIAEHEHVQHFNIGLQILIYIRLFENRLTWNHKGFLKV